MQLPAFPDDALFQFHSGNREGEWSGFRVLLDGRLERQRRDGPWEADAPLDEVRLASLRAALAGAGLQEKQGIYRPEIPPPDATSWALAARDGSGAVLTMGGHACQPDFVQELFDQVAPLLRPAEHP